MFGGKRIGDEIVNLLCYDGDRFEMKNAMRRHRLKETC